jgi:hypothetical protein
VTPLELGRLPTRRTRVAFPHCLIDGGDHVPDVLKHKAGVLLGLLPMAVVLAGCTGSGESQGTDVAIGGPGPCNAAGVHGDVVGEQDTTVGQVRMWQGYGGVATKAPRAIRHFAAGSPPGTAAAWCWVSHQDGYAVYLVGPETVKLVGTFSGNLPSPSGTPIWD